MEVEAKFVVPGAAVLGRLAAAAALAGYDLGPQGGEQRITDVYLDTADRRVTAAGYALRRREGGGRPMVTLKQLQRAGAGGAVHRREELQVEVTADPAVDVAAALPPGPLRERLTSIVGDAALAPLVALSQRRTMRGVRDGERLVAELSLDEVRVSGAASGRYRELEVELRPHGTEEDLAALAACLQGEWGLVPEPRSKLARALEAAGAGNAAASRLLATDERGLALLLATRADLHGRRARVLLALDEGLTQAAAAQRGAMSARRVRYWLAEFRRRRLGVFPRRVLPPQPATGAPPTAGAPAAAAPAAARPPATRRRRDARIGADDAMAEAGRTTLLLHFDRMLSHEEGTRGGEDYEELHDMRVATRRMRAALRVFDDWLEPDVMRPYLRALRKTGRLLGAVRDLDVFHEKAQRYLDGLPEEQSGGLEPLFDAWRAERERHRQRLAAYLDSRAYAEFTARFDEFLHTPGVGARPLFTAAGEALPYRVRHALPVVVHGELAAVLAFGEWVSGPQAPLTRFHRLRIAGKRLRYTLEFFQEMLGSRAKPLIGQVTALQDHLGDLQDAVVTSGVLRDFLTWGTWGPPRRPGAASHVVVAPGVAAYLAFKQAEMERLIVTFPKAWEPVSGAGFRRSLGALLDEL